MPSVQTAIWTTAAALVPMLAASYIPFDSQFEAGVDTVAIYATVTGRGNSLERSLGRDDFEVFDNGRRQPVTVFQAGSLPITAVMLLDDSPSVQGARPNTVVAARAFFDRLTPEDRATVGFFSRTIAIEGGLTGDIQELRSRLDLERQPMAGTALWDALGAGVATLEDEGGRRVILVLTDGDDNSSERSPVDIVADVTRTGIMVYAIGLESTGGRLSESLSRLAKDTGGWFTKLKSRANLTSSFQRIADELHSQYLLGFTPERRDGATHRLEVKVKRRGLTVRARSSYVAPAQE